jgi:hypothetical protein
VSSHVSTLVAIVLRLPCAGPDATRLSAAGALRRCLHRLVAWPLRPKDAPPYLTRDMISLHLRRDLGLDQN